MGVKLNKNASIPIGIEKEHFLEMIKGVYAAQAKSLEKATIKKAA